MAGRRTMLVLLLAALAGCALAEQECKRYVHDLRPESLTGDPVVSSISVDDAFDVGHVRVEAVSLMADRLAPLKVTLSALAPGSDAPKTVVLKGTRSGGAATRLESAVFDDDLLTAFPDGPATGTGTIISGAFAPAQALSSLASGAGAEAGRGGSSGVWTLRVAHLGRSSGVSDVSLESWALVLCPAEESPAAPVNPTIPTSAAPAASPDEEEAVAASNRDEQPDEASTTALLAQVLDRINRVSLVNSTVLTPRDGGIVDSVRGEREGILLARDGLLGSAAGEAVSDGIIASRDGFVFGENSTTAFIQTRIDELLGVATNSSEARSSGWLAGGAGGNVRDAFGVFRVGNTTLPQGPTVQFLQSLRSLVDELGDGGNATTEPTPSDAPAVVAQDGVAGGVSERMASLMSSVASLGASDGGYLGAVSGVLSGLTSKAAERPAASGLAAVANQRKDNRAAAAGTVGSLAQSALDYSSAKLQDTVTLIDSQSALLEAAIKNRLASYDDAITSAGTIITTAISEFSDSVIEQGTAMRAAAMDAKTTVASGASTLKDRLTGTTTGQVVAAQLQHLANTGSSISAVASGFKDSMTGVLGTLLSVYRTQLSTAADIMSTTTDATLQKAQFRAESAVDTLSGVVDAAASALEAAAEGKGPLVGGALETYASGLGAMHAVLLALRERIVAAPAGVDFGALRSALSGSAAASGAQQLEAFWDSLGVGSRATKVISMLGSIDTFDSRYQRLLAMGGDSD